MKKRVIHATSGIVFKQLKILAVGFARKAMMGLVENTRGHQVHQASSFTDARQKMVDHDFNVVLLNADSLSSKEIVATYQLQLQHDSSAKAVAVHGDKVRRKPPKDGRSIAFIPMGKIDEHISVLMAGATRQMAA